MIEGGAVIRIATILLALAVLSGCSFSRGTLGDEFTDINLHSIQKGVSTRADVVAALGAPDRVVRTEGAEIFQYYRYDAKVGSLFLLILNFSRLQIKSDDLYVWIGSNGVVQDILYGRRTSNMKFRYWPFGD
jgi:outer membrane protein assembly factor BamE (lipoprotein component of BamABCDE complex)